MDTVALRECHYRVERQVMEQFMANPWVLGLADRVVQLQVRVKRIRANARVELPLTIIW